MKQESVAQAPARRVCQKRLRAWLRLLWPPQCTTCRQRKSLECGSLVQFHVLAHPMPKRRSLHDVLIAIAARTTSMLSRVFHCLGDEKFNFSPRSRKQGRALCQTRVVVSTCSADPGTSLCLASWFSSFTPHQCLRWSCRYDRVRSTAIIGVRRSDRIGLR